MVLKTTDKILIIDNDTAVRQFISDYLEDGGFEILQTDTVEKGLSIFRAEKPDLILTDLKMPGMTGLELLEILAKESPQTPIVVVSGIEAMDDVIQALKRGAWDYVMKPLKDMILLERSIGKALERSRLVEENRQYRVALEDANQALKKNLDILEQDQEAGRSVQMRLLPQQNVEFGPYTFTHSVVPSLYLSGDFVDYFKINDRHFGFYIADVSGHGASSAFVTVLLKSLVELELTRYEIHGETTILEPDALLSKLATEIYTAKLGKYLTMVYGVINWKDHTFTYSIGGHYPNPIWIENGKAHFLEGKGFPVGIMKQTQYEKHSLIFKEDVQLVMFSDGVAEILKANDLPKKEELLLSLVVASQGKVEYLLKELDLIGKKELPDDVTTLIIKRK
jgi:sigma-B regulation protein RsbU (phosphoserine phosphatase)